MGSKAVLTIDDIASKNTIAIVDFLKEQGIEAVMFAVGENVLKYEKETVYAIRNGMIVGNHSFSHPGFSDLTLEEAKEEILRMEDILDALYQEAGVKRPYKVFRFPYGDKGYGENRKELQKFLRHMGFVKLQDSQVTEPSYCDGENKEEIDTFWSYDFAEYWMHGVSEWTFDKILKRITDTEENGGIDLFKDQSHQILLLHAHDESEAIEPEYYKKLLKHCMEHGMQFEAPEFVAMEEV